VLDRRVGERVLEDHAQSIERRQERLASTRFSMRGSGAITDTDWTFWPKAVLLFNPRAHEFSRVARFAWTALYWNVAVVLWGAYVRATGSGAGCGNKWPLCDGDLVGASAKAQTIVEFTHRITSVISLLMMTSLVVWCWRVTKKGDWARYSAFLAAALLANEALLFSFGTPALLHVRLLHPALAAVAACYVLWGILRFSIRRNRFSQSAIALIVLFVVQVGIGITNVLLLAPVWLQIAHLFVADVLWVLLVLASADLVFEHAGLGEANALASRNQQGQKK
jgi:heme A synthase